MLKDTVNSNRTMGNSEELAEAIKKLRKLEWDFYHVMGIVSVMSDAIMGPGDEAEDTTISGETRVGFMAIKDLVTESCNLSASDVAGVIDTLERLQKRQTMAA